MKKGAKKKTYKRKVRSKVLRRSNRKSLRRSTKKKNTKKKSYRRSARKPLKRTRRTNKLRGGMWDKAAKWFGGTDVTGPAAEPAAEPAAGDAAKPEKTPAEKAKEERDSRVEELIGVLPQLTADEEEEIDTIMQIEDGPKIIEKRFEREAEKYIQRAKRMGIDADKISEVEGLSGFKKYSSAIDLF